MWKGAHISTFFFINIHKTPTYTVEKPLSKQHVTTNKKLPWRGNKENSKTKQKSMNQAQQPLNKVLKSTLGTIAEVANKNFYQIKE